MSTTEKLEQATVATDAVQAQFGEDPQLDVMGALAMMQLARKFNKLEPRDLSIDIPDDEKRMLSILNWIANFFVREPQGDVVATALSTKRHELTLYIAMSRGRPAQADRDNSLKFLDALRQALKESDIRMAEQQLSLAAFSASGERVWRKLGTISGMRYSNHEIVSVFEAFVRKWTTGGGKEGDATLNRHRKHFPDIRSVTTPDAALISIFRQLISCITAWSKSTDRSEKQLYLLCMYAALLCNSTFFTTLPTSSRIPPDPFTAFEGEEYAWLVKLRRRLWRHVHYLTDAGTFVKHGFKYIKSILGKELGTFEAGGVGFNIVWVGDHLELPANHGKRYQWPQKPGDRFRNLLTEYTIPIPKDEDFHDAFNSELGQTGPCKSNPYARPFLHCELQLIQHLQQKEITVYKNVIGVSKLMCFACKAYVTELNDTARPGQLPWLLAGTSGKAHHAWLIPGDPKEPLCSRVLSRIQEELKKRIAALAAKFGHTRNNSGGSDSSAGSRADVDELDLVIDGESLYATHFGEGGSSLHLLFDLMNL